MPGIGTFGVRLLDSSWCRFSLSSRVRLLTPKDLSVSRPAEFCFIQYHASFIKSSRGSHSPGTGFVAVLKCESRGLSAISRRQIPIEPIISVGNHMAECQGEICAKSASRTSSPAARNRSTICPIWMVSIPKRRSIAGSGSWLCS
jgi:hypothetical protein